MYMVTHARHPGCVASLLLFLATAPQLSIHQPGRVVSTVSVSHFGARIDRLAAMETHLLLHCFKAVPVFKIQL